MAKVQDRAPSGNFTVIQCHPLFALFGGSSVPFWSLFAWTGNDKRHRANLTSDFRLLKVGVTDPSFETLLTLPAWARSQACN
jgi:hypothetical protein